MHLLSLLPWGLRADGDPCEVCHAVVSHYNYLKESSNAYPSARAMRGYCVELPHPARIAVCDGIVKLNHSKVCQLMKQQLAPFQICVEPT
jgi:hypothetical protein